MISVQITDNGLVARIAELSSQVKRPVAIAKAVQREGVLQLKAHFITKESTDANKLGGKRQHFWRQVSASVNRPEIAGDGNQVVIRISHPLFAQKLFGGEIYAKNAKALTIPVSKESYGRTTKVFEAETGLKLFVIRHRGEGQGTGLLASANKKGNGITVRYLLRTHVHQEPDPTALPDMDTFRGQLLARAETVAARLVRRANSGSNPPTDIP